MPKLPKGMYRRGRAYYCRFQRGGRDVRKSLGSSYEQAIDSFRRLVNGSQSVDAVTLLVEDAIERWIETGVAAARIPTGRRDVAARIRRYVVPRLGERRLADIRPNDLLALRVAFEAEGFRPTLVHRVLSDTRAFFRWAALDARLIAEPPIPRRLLPRLQQRFPERLTDEEVEAVTGIPDPYGFIVRLALATGLRWGELTRVQTSHIQRGVLHVAQTKSGKVRKVPVPPAMLAELRDRIGRLVSFTHPGMFARQVRKLSGVDRFHVHLTRHTFACRWVEAGGNLAVLQAILGHSSVLVTERYGRLSDEAILAEAKRISGKSGTDSGTVARVGSAKRAVNPH